MEKKFEEKFTEHDKKKFDILLNLSRNVKDLCQDGIKALKRDLEIILEKGKAKWNEAVSELQHIPPEEKPVANIYPTIS